MNQALFSKQAPAPFFFYFLFHLEDVREVLSLLRRGMVPPTPPPFFSLPIFPLFFSLSDTSTKVECVPAMFDCHDSTEVQNTMQYLVQLPGAHCESLKFITQKDRERGAMAVDSVCGKDIQGCRGESRRRVW